MSEVNFLMNDNQIRPTTNIVISTENARQYIENSVSSLEQILTKYYDIFPSSSEYTGYTSNIWIANFYDNIVNENSGSVTILGVKSLASDKSEESSKQSSSSQESSDSESSSSGSSNSKSKSSSSESSNTNTSSQNSTSENSNSTQSENIINNSIDNIEAGKSIVFGDRGTENIGLCVFKDDIYVGNLSAIETLCYSLLENEVYNFVVSIDNPFDETNKIDLSVSRLSTSSFSVDTSSENPVITITLNLTAKALTSSNSLNFYDTEILNKLNEKLKEYMSFQMENYLYKTSKDYKCDINNFYRVAKKKFITSSDFKNYNWKEKYQNSEFKLDINSSIISSLLIQN